MFRQCINILEKIFINKVPLNKLNKNYKKFKWEEFYILEKN